MDHMCDNETMTRIPALDVEYQGERYEVWICRVMTCRKILWLVDGTFFDAAQVDLSEAIVIAGEIAR